jgi:hypothetical protein
MWRERKKGVAIHLALAAAVLVYGVVGPSTAIASGTLRLIGTGYLLSADIQETTPSHDEKEALTTPAPATAAKVVGKPADLAEVEIALGEDDLSSAYRDYLKSKERLVGKSFAEYEYGEARYVRNWGKVLTLGVGPGLIVLAGATALFFYCYAGICTDCEGECDNTFGFWAATGLTAFFAGPMVLLSVSAFIVGGILWHNYGEDIEKLERLMKEKKTAGGGAIRFAGLAPLFGRRGSPEGMVVVFRF